MAWLFLAQCNYKPSHPSFLNQANGFFDQTAFPNLRRENACLVFANCAGSARPGKVSSHGSSGAVFARQTMFSDAKCSPTFRTRYPGREILKDQRDLVFREGGACIHSFSLLNPGAQKAGAVHKEIAFRNARVFRLAPDLDPRAPDQEVVAST